MGYIAPVTNYQYNQYAERELNNDYDPYHFKAIMRTGPTVNERLQQSSSKTISNKKTLKREKVALEKVKNHLIVDAIYGELTGKGQHFNEMV